MAPCFPSCFIVFHTPEYKLFKPSSILFVLCHSFTVEQHLDIKKLFTHKVKVLEGLCLMLMKNG